MSKVTNLVVDSPCSFLEWREKKKKEKLQENIFNNVSVLTLRSQDSIGAFAGFSPNLNDSKLLLKIQSFGSIFLHL